MSNVIKIGNLTIDSFKVGAADCSIYLGTTKLYPQGEPPTPPVFEGKYKLTLSDSSVVSAACDGTSAITQDEISAYTSTTVAVELGECVTSIGTNAFRNFSGITSVELPDSVVSISDGAFRSCTNLASISLPSSLTSIGGGAFRSCTNLASVVIPDSVSGISYDVFSDCVSLSSVTIPSSVTSIGYTAFKRCSGLTSVDIPSGVTRIAFEAFSYCTNLERITVEAVVPPTLEQNVFYGSTCPIYVPCESVEAYKSATGWSNYESRIACIPTFEGKYKLTLSNGDVVSAACDGTNVLERKEISAYSQTCVSAEVGDCVTKIATNAFSYFHSLSSVTISDSVVNIYSSFSYCDSLTSIGEKGSGASIELPTGLTTIRDTTFDYCTGLTSVTIPSSITSIGYGAFSECTSLPSIVIPSGVTYIDAYAFANCTGLTEIIVEATTPQSLGGYAFDNTNNCPIYVPSGSVDAYKTATNWNRYADRFQAISSGQDEPEYDDWFD